MHEYPWDPNQNYLEELLPGGAGQMEGNDGENEDGEYD